MYWFRRAPFLPVILNNVKDPRAKHVGRRPTSELPPGAAGSRQLRWRVLSLRCARGFFAGSE